MKITQIEKQKNNPLRCNVFLDGEFAFGANEDLVIEKRLRVGLEISSNDLEKILFESEVGKLIARVYRLLERRMRSEKEIREYLKNLSYKRAQNIRSDESKAEKIEQLSSLVIDTTIKKLKQKNFINDKEFTVSWIEARRRSKKKGLQALRMELRQKGVAKEISEPILNRYSNSKNEEKLAGQALEQKMKSWHNLPSLNFKRKSYGFLLRKGFDYSVVQEIVEKFLKRK